MSADLKQLLASINLEYSFTAAEQEFADSNVKLENPRHIHEEFSYQKQLFSKLKFIYLEQETRDKFLRKISEISSDDLKAEDVGQIETETIAKKAAFRRLKSEMSQQIDLLDSVVLENIELYDKSRAKLDETNFLLGEIGELETKINGILEEEDEINQNSQLISSLVDSEGYDETNFENVVTGVNEEVNKKLELLNELTSEIEEKQTTNSEQQRHLQESTDELQKLKNAAETGIGNQVVEEEAKADPEQSYAKWCVEMNRIVAKYFDVKFLRLKAIPKAGYELTIQNTPQPVVITFNGDFKVTDVEGPTDEKWKRKLFDSCGNEDLVKELALFIATTSHG